MNLALFAPFVILGAVGSSHCVTMCGAMTSHFCAVPGEKLRSSKAFALLQTGRILSYGFMGALAGGIGSVPGTGAVGLVLRAMILGLSALVLLFVGLQLLGIGGAGHFVERIGAPLWKKVSAWVRPLSAARHPLAKVLLGSVLGWIPCGLSYSALVLSMNTGSAPGGALAMILFGLGTTTALYLATLAGAISLKPTIRFAGTFRTFAGVLLLVSAAIQTQAAMGQWSAPQNRAVACCKH